MAGKSRTKKSKVIDVGDKPSEEDEADDAEADAQAEDKEEGLDTDLVEAAPIDVGEEAQDESVSDGEGGDGHDVPRVPVKREAGSLARRDPLSTYMSETRRYPLLTADEEHALAVRLVE
ncbi:MAG: sigma-70 factor domain-containing protein, partial [Kofleriaceae bacterium]